MVRALEPARRPRARDRRQLAGRHRRDRRPARRGARLRRGAAPRAQGGSRPCVPRRLPPRARRRGRPRPRDGLRLLPRPGRRTPADRGVRTGPTSRSARAMSRAAARRTGAPARRLVSTGGSSTTRTLLGVRIRDLTGGFKCYRRAVLETIDLDASHSKGYAFQIETTYRALRQGSPSSRCRSVRHRDAGRFEDEPRHRPRSGLLGARAAPRRLGRL